MKKIFKKILIFIGVSVQFNLSYSQNTDFWKEKDINSIPNHESRYAMPEKYRTFSFDIIRLRSYLTSAPMEFSAETKTASSQLILKIPMPDGTISRFSIVESPMMEAGLASQFPDFKTYSGQGIDDPAATLKLSITRFGLHVMILSPKGSFFIDPFDQFSSENYICYNKKDFTARQFVCETADDFKNNINNKQDAFPSLNKSHGTQLRNYRLALAATAEYTTFHGGTVPSAMAAIVASINRVNGVYEKEVAIRLTLVANNSSIVYTNSVSDPYTNNSGTTMLSENTTNLNATILTANYDIGHVFSTGGGGVATLNGPCGSNKARGVTGSSSPVGDGFDIDYVAHEMGHQFGANHTFNATTGSCGGGNRSAAAAYEPGSGITIMAYAGICTVTNDLAAHSIAYFHTKSFDEITTFITNVTTGGSCPTTTSTGNTPPTSIPGSDFTIPISTPFILTGSGTDADSDPLTYSWEQFDLGTAGDWNAAQTIGNNAPLFRPFDPVNSPSRTFPKLSDIINNTTTIGEILPTVSRTLHFRLTVRDNKNGGGGVTYNDVTKNVMSVSTAGPFLITSPNTAVSWGTGTTQTVTWNVASTNVAPVNCTNVNILLSIDGGNTFPTALSLSTANDGSESITIPGTVTSSARIKVESVGNIFFDMSNTNFSITPSSPVLTAIITNPLGASNYCAGSNLSVSYSCDGPANAGNIFTAQLSDSSGSFTTPATIGTLASTISGTISCTISAATIAGNSYRIRVVSSNPSITGSNNGSNISIFKQVTAAGSITGSLSVCQGQTNVAYNITALPNATSYNWTLPSGGSIASGINTNSIVVNYSAVAITGNITVAGTNSGCGNGTTSGLLVTVNSLPSAPGTITGPSSVCLGTGGYIYNVPAISGATGYIWTLPSGATVTAGINTNSITIAFSGSAVSGNITVTGTNTCGSGSVSSPFSIVLASQPTPAVVNAGGPTTMCAPGNVNLSFSPLGGHHYQWRKNGINLNTTDTLSSYTAAQTGNYDVISSIFPGNAATFNSTGSTSILDNSCSTSSNNIIVSGYNTSIPSSQIYITINISHTWVGDLVMILEAPNGQRLGLCNRLNNGGNNGDNFNNTVFTDAASGTLPVVTGAPYTGSYKPLSTFFTVCTNVTTNVASFAGFNSGSIIPNGQWRLRVFDQASEDGGTISNWSITFPAYSSGCSSPSNAIPVTINPLPVVSGFTPSSGTVGSIVNINGSGFTGTSSVQFNGISAAYSVVSDILIQATVPAGFSNGVINITNPCGNANSASSFTVITSAVLNLNIFLEGYYEQGGTLYNGLGGGNVDSVTVSLVDSTNLNVVAYSSTIVLNTTGNLSIIWPASTVGNKYYIVLSHRNSLETWSKNPVLFGATNNLNFKN
ncbi:MAG: reprolysin-like metallopeptidase [Bacteroidota bacterium]